MQPAPVHFCKSVSLSLDVRMVFFLTTIVQTNHLRFQAGLSLSLSKNTEVSHLIKQISAFPETNLPAGKFITSAGMKIKFISYVKR